jgi:BlaI family transcriptional regulator, penicillinase repressor
MATKQKIGRQLTPLELQIMKVLWDSGPSTVLTVQDRLSVRPKLAYTTVQTMLNVLHRKGHVKRKLHGKAFEYEALLSKESASSNAIRDMVDRVFGGSVEDLLMSLVKSKELNPKKLAKLKAVIDNEVPEEDHDRDR